MDLLIRHQTTAWTYLLFIHTRNTQANQNNKDSNGPLNEQSLRQSTVRVKDEIGDGTCPGKCIVLMNAVKAEERVELIVSLTWICVVDGMKRGIGDT